MGSINELETWSRDPSVCRVQWLFVVIVVTPWPKSEGTSRSNIFSGKDNHNRHE